MKNKILIYLFSFSTIGLFHSCSDNLELEPAQSISENIVLDTDRNVKNVLNGAYSVLQRGAIYGGEIIRNGELLAGDGEILFVGTFGGPRQIFNKQMIAENEDVRRQWTDSYNAINVVNNVLTAIPVVNEDDRERVEGEALFIRGMVYFDLVRYYAKTYEAGQANTQPGVPLVLTPTRGIDASNSVARNSVEEVYNQVIADLTRAASLLPATNGISATSGAANALLARVYLQKGDFAKARDAANTVIESGEYILKTDYASVFNADVAGSEDIFAIEFTSQDAAASTTEFWSIPQFGGRDGDIEILPGHLALYEADDERLALFFEGAAAIRSGKWNNQFGVVNLFRLAEMYLIRAETNQRLGTSIGATPLSDYNTIHTRAGLAAKNNISLVDIISEKRLELAHEGHKIHEHKRLKLDVGDLPYNDPKLIFPIPARELESNPSLTQNDGY